MTPERQHATDTHSQPEQTWEKGSLNTRKQQAETTHSKNGKTSARLIASGDGKAKTDGRVRIMARTLIAHWTNNRHQAETTPALPVVSQRWNQKGKDGEVWFGHREALERHRAGQPLQLGMAL